MKFLVNIEEVIHQNFEVEAETMEDAVKIVKSAYSNGEMVLENGELISASVEVYDEENECWRENVDIY